MTRTRYDEFLNRVRERGEHADQEETAKITTAVLEALAQRITPGEASGVAAQLPEPLGEPLKGGGQGQAQRFGVEEFCQRVAERTGARPRTAEWDSSAVLSTPRWLIRPDSGRPRLREGEPPAPDLPVRAAVASHRVTRSSCATPQGGRRLYAGRH